MNRNQTPHVIPTKADIQDAHRKPLPPPSYSNDNLRAKRWSAVSHRLVLIVALTAGLIQAAVCMAAISSRFPFAQRHHRCDSLHDSPCSNARRDRTTLPRLW